MVPVTRTHLAQRLLLVGSAAALFLAGSLSPTVRAAPSLPTASGELDTSFGGYGEGGRLLTPVYGTEPFHDAVQLPDGSVIAVGSTGAAFLIAKYTPDGQPDPGFGTQGVQTVELSAAPDSANAVAVAADGKILAAGMANTSTAGDFGLVRLNPDGTPDSTFGNGGIKTIDFNGNRDTAEALSVVEQSGDILVAGSARTGGLYCPPLCFDNLALARLKSADGALDSSFGTGGRVQTDLGGNERASVLAAGPCGLYVAGSRAADLNAPHYSFIARYNTTDGSLRTGFGANGVVTSTALTRMVDLACLGPYSLLALGDGPGDGDAGDVGLLHLTDIGTPVAGFGASGFVKHDFGGVDAAGALAVLPDGTALVAGTSGLSLAAARFDRAGSIVTGTVALMDLAELGGTAVQALDVALVPDVRYRTVASLEIGVGPRLALTQRFLNGSPDDGGRQALDYQRQPDDAAALAFQPDGKLLVAGLTRPSGGGVVGLMARYTVGGELDAQFGQGGVLSLDSLPGGARRLLVEPDGKIIALGRAFNLVRLNADGQADTTFGSQGLASANWPGATSVAIGRQAHGKLVVAGYRQPAGGGITFAVARFTAGGVLDSTFGANGTVATGLGAGSAGIDVAVQPDGKIVVTGYMGSELNNPLSIDFALVRYLPDGNVDNAFGTNGRVTTDFGNTDTAHAVVVLPGDKLLVAGHSQSQGMAFARYLPNGALDLAFGSGGKLLLGFTGGEVITDLVHDGIGLVAAVCDQTANTRVVARLTLDAAFDTRFNGTGRALFDFPGVECLNTVAAAPGRIAAAGSTETGVGYFNGYLTRDFAVAVYRNDPYATNPMKLFLPFVERTP